MKKRHGKLRKDVEFLIRLAFLLGFDAFFRSCKNNRVFTFIYYWPDNPFNCQITGNNLFLETWNGRGQRPRRTTTAAGHSADPPGYVANWSIELVLQIIFPRNTVDLHHLDFIP